MRSQAPAAAIGQAGEKSGELTLRTAEAARVPCVDVQMHVHQIAQRVRAERRRQALAKRERGARRRTKPCQVRAKAAEQRAQALRQVLAKRVERLRQAGMTFRAGLMNFNNTGLHFLKDPRT